MNIVFTVCSVNYLASAKCLCQSIKFSNPSIKFIYVIADKINKRIEKQYFEGEEYIEVENLKIPNLNELVSTYNLIEFNTAIKPFAIKFLGEKYGTKKIIYFDPDIILFDKIDFIWNNLEHFDFIVTPHILNPIVNELFYNHQKGALNTGVFNLGFIAVNFNENSSPIIEWWCYHMINHGHSNSSIGEFYDQKIMNLLPIFSNKVLIEKHAGCNVAGWNIHERNISKIENKYLINNLPLIFYHYSGFIFDPASNLISKYNHLKRDFNSYIKEILQLYKENLKQNNHQKLSTLECAYDLMPNIHKIKRGQMLHYKIKKYLGRWKS
jgi:hypothetical protein